MIFSVDFLFVLSYVGTNEYLSIRESEYLFRGLIEGTVTAKVSSSRNRRNKVDRIGESQPFQERTLSV
jgi:hypothetical protein